MNDAVHADTSPLRRCCRAACVVAALAAGALNATDIAVVAQAQTQPAGAGDDAQAVAGGSWCSRIPPGFGHPPVNLTPVTLQVLQRSIEPVPATDGLIHLPYVAQVTNTQPTPHDIFGVVPVDPLAGFVPTGRNFIIDEQGRDLAGKVRLFDTLPDNTLPDTTRVPAGNSGLMFFD